MDNIKNIASKWLADMYDLNETYTDDTEFALSVIGAKPKRILEIACGSGRFLVPMAKAGHNVTGLDFDEYMLEKIPAKTVGLNNISWRKADAICDEWGNGFDVVALSANFLFNIVSDMDYKEAQKLLIQKSADALITGGHVFIDCGYTQKPEKWFNKQKEDVVFKGTDSNGNTGKMVLLKSTFDEKSGTVRFIRRFELTLTDGSTVIHDIPSEKHFASLEQIHEWLSLAGFIVEKEYGDYKCNPISRKTTRAVIWARKI